MNTNTEIQKKLSALADSNGIFQILAFDHRGSFKKMMQKSSEAEVTDEQATDLKEKIIKALSDKFTGVLIDQDYGLPAYKKLGLSEPFLLPTEKTGYTDEAGERITELMYTGESIVNDGATAMKILIYANKNVPSWEKQLETSGKALMDAHDHDLPFFLEFVLYSTETNPSSDINETLKDTIAKGVVPDVWKIPYPGSADKSKETTSVVGEVPWVLLTGGTTFDEFLEQYKLAYGAGAKGFVAGRALWQEACDMWTKPEELDVFLNQTLVERFEKLASVR
jgi:tagatose 1,6-diphosphate aldolase